MSDTTGARPVAGGPLAPTQAVTTAVLLATAAGGPAGVAAALPLADATVLERQLDQLRELGVPDVHVVVRPPAAGVVEPLVAGRAGVRVRVSPDPAADLRLVAALARERPGALFVGYGDVVTQRSVMADLLADARVATAVLTTVRPIARPFGFRLRGQRGQVVGAASPFHVVHGADATFLGLVKVLAADRDRVAAIAERLAALVADPPESWRRQRDELRPGSWRLALGSIARARAERAAAGLAHHEDDEDVDEEALLAASEEQAVAVELGLHEAESTGDVRHPGDVQLEPDDEAELERRVAAAREDVVSLLVAGMVRDGMAVGNVRLRGFFWARPLSEAKAQRAERRLAEHDEEAWLLRSAVKVGDGFFTTFFVSPYSRYIARWCAHRGLTPNLVTSVSMLFGILAAAGFATGERWGLVAGALVLQAAFTLDCVDGQLARYTRNFSKLGAWLDSVFDRAKEYVVFAGLAYGATRMGHDAWALACAALGLQTTRHFVDFSYPIAQRQMVAATPQPPLEQVGDGLGPEVPRWARDEAPARARPKAKAAPARPKPAPSRPVRILAAWRRLGRGPRARWAKKAFAFPIGERFAAISLTAALFDARVTFITLLVWGGLATSYVAGGRLLRALRPAARRFAPGGDGRLESLRDDGPLARLVGAAGRALPSGPTPLALGAVAVLAVVVAATWDGASDAVAAVTVALVVLLAGLGAGRALRDPLRWAVPPLLRALEFGGITWLAAQAGTDALPAAFALLSAAAFRHYDNVYRQRQRGQDAPDWMATLGLGWDGRLLGTLVLVLVAVVPAGLFAAAAALGLLFAGEAAHGWATFTRAGPVPAPDDDEEAE